MTYSIGQVAQKTGLSAHTLRYYEKEGLLPFVKKTHSGIRTYNDEDIGWLSMIECLKMTGMSLKDIRQYIEWFSEGDSSLPNRLELFRKRKADILKEMETLKTILGKVEFKIRLYEEAVKLGSLDLAMQSQTIQKLRKKLFGNPHFIPTRNDDAERLSASAD